MTSRPPVHYWPVARCGGKPRIIASIEEPEFIARILAHLEKAAGDD